MIQKYTTGQWYTVDLWLDWDEQRVSIYINDTPLKSETFFTQHDDIIESANALSIYSLSPGSVSYFKNIRVCNDICESDRPKNLHTLSSAAFGYSFSLAATLSALYFGLLA